MLDKYPAIARITPGKNVRQIFMQVSMNDVSEEEIELNTWNQVPNSRFFAVSSKNSHMFIIIDESHRQFTVQTGEDQA